MAAQQRRCSCLKKPKSVVIAVSGLILIVNYIMVVQALYIPDSQLSQYDTILRRQDSDEDDMDRGASAPYQNQDDGQGGNADGYEDGEADGPYDETPKDEEGQADLERFFDDHLGASERDGMDKENLPTNLVPIVLNNPLVYSSSSGADRALTLADVSDDDQKADGSSPGTSTTIPQGLNEILNNPSMSYLDSTQLPNVETRFIKLPNKNKLIITRQITRGPIYKGGLDLSHVPQILQMHDDNQNFKPSSEKLEANGSEIIATENDDMDPIYVTRQTNKPFKIEALGGYDPEEDFQDASRDFEESEKQNSRRNRRKDSRDDQQEPPVRDISFNDPEADTLFNDASETDEIFFAHDPYPNNLEAEIRGDLSPDKADNESDGEQESEQQSASQPNAEADSSKDENVIARNAKNDDEEGGWANDGVEDMDIPSQSDQDTVLEKAAKQEALAKRAGSPEEEAQQPEVDPEDPDNQRMPNADYLKEDMKVDEPDERL